MHQGEQAFRPRTSPIPQSSYSPAQYSPITAFSPSMENSHSEDFMHYYKLLKKAILRYNRNFFESQIWYLTFSGGNLIVLEKRDAKLCIAVSTAIEMSNIYHLFKGLDNDTESGCMMEFIQYLKFQGIPTFVQAVHTGNTPNFDENDYIFDSVERLH